MDIEDKERNGHGLFQAISTEFKKDLVFSRL
jgi:hypothetical protein